MAGLLDLGMANRGSLVINPGGVASPTLSTNLRTAAWWVLDYLPLIGTPSYRGGNVLIPDADGFQPYRRRVTETTYSLEMLVTGKFTRAGVATADQVSGLQDNLDDLRQNVEPGTASTRSATLTLPDSSTLTASVQCVLTPGVMVGPGRIRAVLDVTVPAGRFA